MASLNQCQFIGNLGADPEIKYTQSGSAVTNISVAATESWKDKESGEKQERTEWVRVTAFGKLAEIMAEYLKKGSQVYVSGRMQTDKYEKDGIERYSTKIIADKMIMLGGKQDGQKSSGDYAKKGSHKSTQASQPKEQFIDDDIPFVWALVIPIVGLISSFGGGIPGV